MGGMGEWVVRENGHGRMDVAGRMGRGRMGGGLGVLENGSRQNTRGGYTWRHTASMTYPLRDLPTMVMRTVKGPGMPLEEPLPSLDDSVYCSGGGPSCSLRQRPQI